MSQENVEPLERLYRAWNERDVDGIVSVFHPDAKFWPSGAFPGLKALYEKHAGMREFFADFASVWESLVIVPERYVERDGRVVALWRFEARGRDDVRVERRGAHVARVEAGLITEMRSYADWPAALEAVGLRE